MTGPTDRFAVPCPHCAAKLRVRFDDLGAERACPKCQTRFRLPDRRSVAKAERIRRAKSEFSFPCRLCGSLLYAEPGQVGGTLACPDCHASNVIPAGSPPKRVGDVTPLPLGEELKLQEPDHPPEERFAVKCGVCDGIDFATEAQIGKSLLCRDCGSTMLVKAPPPRPKSKIRAVDPGIEIAPAAEMPVPVSNAAALLEKARLEVDRQDALKPIPPKRPFRDGIYSYPWYSDILPRWIVVAALVCVLGGVFQMGMTAKGLEQIIALFLGIVFVVGSLILSGIHATFLMTVVEWTAQGYDKVPHWGGTEILDRIRTTVRWWAAVGFSTLPAVLVGMAIPGRIPFYAILAAPMAFVLFPLVFLSMLDADSIAIPYSRLIWKSWRRFPRLWRSFYLMSFPLFLVCAGGTVLMAYRTNNYVAILLGVALVVSSVIYARLLGRLGWSLDQVMTADLLEEISRPTTSKKLADKVPLDI